MACGRDRSEDHEQPTTPSCSQSWELGTAFFPSSPVSTSSGLDDQSADERGDDRKDLRAARQRARPLPLRLGMARPRRAGDVCARSRCTAP
ncbi:hypothetical protein L227DRAFT_582164, partial [Lentinus tigrinus ALCF2SS1-6]